MDPIITGSLIAGGASALGGILGNRSASDEAKKNRQWQERMSKTAHQREVGDLIKAGLNPMLSERFGGSGATSAPSGAVAQQHDPISPAVNSAMTAKMNGELINKVRAETQVASATAAKIRAETPDTSTTVGGDNVMTNIRDRMHAEMQKAFADRNISEQTAMKISQEVANLKTQGDLLDLEKLLKEADLPEAAARARYFASEYGQYYHFGVNEVMKGASSVGNLRNQLRIKNTSPNSKETIFSDKHGEVKGRKQERYYNE